MIGVLVFCAKAAAFKAASRDGLAAKAVPEISKDLESLI